MSRHAFLILAHHKPAQLARLTGALRHAQFDVFVHVDQKADLAAFDVLPNVAERISTRDVQWAGFEMIGATLDLLRLARGRHDYQTYSLLSGADFPALPADRLYDELEGLDASRIDAWTDKDPTWHERYARPFFHDHRFRRLLNGLSRRFGKWFAPRVPDGIEVHFGSQWWTLHRSGAEAMLDFLERRPEVERFARRVHIPDEMFFQTVLAATGAPRVQGGRRFIDWSGELSAHPHLLTEDHVPQITSGRWLFARKFDEDRHPGVLDALERAWETLDSPSESA